MSRESFMRRGEGKGTPSHQRAPKQEREIAARVGGRVTSGSGNKWEKGDVRKPGVIRIEAKTTKHKSFSVTLDMIRKIEEAALSHGELPCILVEFNDGEGNKVCEVAVLPVYAIDLLV